MRYRLLFWLILLTCSSGLQAVYGQSEVIQDSTGWIKVNKISLEGNKRTRDHIIFRELNIVPGDSIPIISFSEFLEVEKNKIFNTGLFNSVEIQKTLRASEVDLHIVVDERWYIWPSIQVDFGDRNFNEWLERGASIDRLVFGVTFHDKNFRGRNEQFKVRGQIGFTRKFEIFYDLPYIDKQRKTGIGFKVSYSENDEVAWLTVDNKLDYVRDGGLLRRRFYAQVGVERRNQFFSRHNVTAAYRDFWVGDTIVALNPDYFGGGIQETEYLQLSYQYTYDKRNIAFYPTSGHRVTAKVDKLGLGIVGPIDIWKVQLTGSKYVEMNERLSSGTYLSIFTSFPRDFQPYFEYGGLGYQDNILRGFDLYVVNARSYILSKNEIRFRLFSYTQDLQEYMPVRQFRKVPVALYFKLLADAGISEDPFINQANPLFANSFLGSLGAGLDLTSFYDLVFRLEYSYNSNQEHNVFFNIHAAF